MVRKFFLISILLIAKISLFANTILDENSKVVVFEFVSQDVSYTNYQITAYQNLIANFITKQTGAKIIKKSYNINYSKTVDEQKGELEAITGEADCRYYIFCSITGTLNYVSITLELVDIETGFEKKSTITDRYAIDQSKNILKAVQNLLNSDKENKPDSSSESLEESDYKFVKRDFIFVIGGSFYIGGNYHNEDNRPALKVNVESFYISPYEVTNYEFEKFVEKTDYKIEDGAFHYNKKGMMVYSEKMNWREPGYKYSAFKPVTCVNWYDAITYCNWLSKMHNEEEYYVFKQTSNGKVVQINKYSAGYRLPTEDEWEYACSGGRGEKKKIFSGSDNIDEVAIYSKNSSASPNFVGVKKHNELNLYDMSGNVFEWCYDVYNSRRYKQMGEKIETDYRVYRGGSWYSSPFNCLVISRFSNNPKIRSNLIGFRVVKNSYPSKELFNFYR